MLLEVSIIYTVYIGTRVYEKYKKSQCSKNKHTSVKPIKSTQITTKKDVGYFDTEKKHQHYFKVSTLSLGLMGITQFIYRPLLPLSFSLYIYTVIPKIREVEKWLFEKRKLDSELLFLIADTTAVAINQYFAAAFSIFFYHRAREAVAKAKGYSEQLVFNIFEQPDKIWILRNGVEIEIPLEAIKINDIVVISAGEIIPVDGKIFDGIATIDQHTLTGESQPIEKTIDDLVFASTMIITGRIYVKVEKSGQETTIAKIGDILNRSTSFKSSLQLKGEEWANKGNLPMLITGGLFILPIFGPATMGSFFFSHIGGPIKLLAPLGTLNYISLASHKNILIKDGRVLEHLVQVDTILFDKTGTLTDEQPCVGQIICYNNYEENEILTYAAAAERKFTHPIAKAIFQKAKEMQLDLPEIDDSKYQIGYGITVNIENKMIRVGSLRFLIMEGLSIPETIQEFQANSHSRYSLVFVAINDKVSGAIEIQSQVRPEVQAIISGLRQYGIKQIAIVSGDHKQPTQNLAKQLGMDSYFYEVLPEQKAKIVEQLQKEGKSVCFVGDGINDAIAMKKANVSISLRGATSVATDVAEVVLMDGSLSHLQTLFDISRSLDANMHNSLHIVLATSAINLSGAFLLHFNILIAAMICAAGMTVGLTNTMQPLMQIRHEEKKNKRLTHQVPE